MTREERAEKLLQDFGEQIIYSKNGGHVRCRPTVSTCIKLILVYADEIRAEAAEKVEKLRDIVVTRFPAAYESGMIDAYNNAIDAITGKEPTK